jgi:hypothetical protein
MGFEKKRQLVGRRATREHRDLPRVKAMAARQMALDGLVCMTYK